jgi:hypothetical protein
MNDQATFALRASLDRVMASVKRHGVQTFEQRLTEANRVIEYAREGIRCGTYNSYTNPPGTEGLALAHARLELELGITLETA